jgi:ADP-heptose:LPS heptosyltransferase
MYTDAIPRARQLTPRHSVMNQWDLLAPLGISALDPARDPVQMPDDDQAVARVGARLAGSGVNDHRLIVIHVSASTRFKRWPEDSFVSLVVALVRLDESRRVCLVSGPSDMAAAQRIADAARARLGTLGKAVLEERPLHLTDLRALIARAAVFVGGDSGPVHIAATTQVPIVELLGPTLAERSFPWRDPCWFTEILDPGALPCRPCLQVPDQHRRGTGCRRHRAGVALEPAAWSPDHSRLERT